MTTRVACAAGLLFCAPLAMIVSLAGAFESPGGRPDVPAASGQAEAVGIEHLRQWLHAVDGHQPGTLDEPALAISSWSMAEMSAVLTTFKKALTELSDQQLGQLPGLTPDEVRRRDASRILQRGALLHADVAMLAQDRARSRSAPVPAAEPAVFLVLDGREMGLGSANVHWEFARALLDEVRPFPERDAFVRLWYRASAAFMQGKQQCGELTRHLERARRLFPADADLLFFSGAVHDAASAPGVQIVRSSITLARGFRLDVKDTASELLAAERYFRDALRHNPGMTEARVRLGWVLARRGRPRLAAPELRAARGAADDPVVRYYAELFLGRAEQATGNPAAARASYERAAAIFPYAQSPYLALSQLARQSGDRAGALGAFQPLRFPADGQDRDDPWWNYHASAGRHADAWLAELRSPFLRQGGPR